MKLSYCTTLRDEKLEIDLIHDFECEIEVSADLDCGFTYFSIDAIFVDGVNICRGTHATQLLAGQIANNAEDDLNTIGNVFRERALEREAA